MTEYLTTDQTAKYVHLHRGTLANMRSRGEGPAYVKVGSKVLYPLAAIESYLAGRTYGGAL